jgi:hypothetical protein
MTRINETLLAMSHVNSQGDEVDDLLRAFFRSEMPDPWPAWSPSKPPASLPTPAPRPRLRPLFRSRFTLAASVAILLIGQLWLLGSYKKNAGRLDSAGREAPAVDVARPPLPRSGAVKDPNSGPESSRPGVPTLRPTKNMR